MLNKRQTKKLKGIYKRCINSVNRMTPTLGIGVSMDKIKESALSDKKSKMSRSSGMKIKVTDRRFREQVTEKINQLESKKKK